MSLLKRLFAGNSKAPAARSSSFADSEPVTGVASSRSVPRREVVHVVLRDSMRRHGIPSEWIECRTLGLVQANRNTGTYVTLIVKSGQDRLLPYVPAFQSSFLNALKHFDPKAEEWLRGLAWQFDFSAAPEPRAMPDPRTWHSSGASTAPAAGLASGKDAVPQGDVDGLQADLRALFAIRDAAINDPPTDAQAFKPTERGKL